MAAPSENFKHDYTREPSSTSDDDIDPVEQMLIKTGCIELHYAVQDCMAEHRDWRKCQDVVQKFKDCMDESNRRLSTA